MDNLSIQERSIMMSKIRSNNTKPEILLRKALFAKGLRYKINDKQLQGKPDIVLSKYKTVVFVHGCFWHNHKGCKISHLPKSNIEYWENKIRTNEERDFKNQDILKQLGWNVVVVWECELKTKEKIEQTVINLTKNFEI